MKSQTNLFKNVTVKSFMADKVIYTLEKRADNLYMIRNGTKTLSLSTSEASGLEKFAKLEASLKGGEKTDMSGEDKFKETGAKLKAEAAEKAEKQEKAMAEVKNSLAAITNNADLAAMYNQSASMGAENLSGNAPYLKVHAAGKSTTNFLADGKKPNDGWFFYKPTQEQFEELDEVHILTICKGFYAEGMNEDEHGKKKMVFNQVMGGVFKHPVDGDYKAFIMFLTGVKLSPMWEFGKEASRWTKAKPVSIPMFALTVKLKTEEVKTKFGVSWIINFEIVKEGNFPKLITDPGEFQFLKDNVETTAETINSLVAAKTAGEEIEETTVAAPIRAAEVVEEEEDYAGDGLNGQVVDPSQEVDPEQIPF
jgi:hypothetical protein